MSRREAEDYSLDSNTLLGIYVVTYGTNDTKTQGLPLHALRARVGATQESRDRTARLSEVQVALLESPPQTEEVQERMTGLRNFARARFDAMWWRRPDSNGHPAISQTAALPVELRPHRCRIGNGGGTTSASDKRGQTFCACLSQQERRTLAPLLHDRNLRGAYF